MVELPREQGGAPVPSPSELSQMHEIAREKLRQLKESEMQRQQMFEQQAAQQQADIAAQGYRSAASPDMQIQQRPERFQGLRQSLGPSQVGAIELSEDPEEQARQIAAARAGQ
jgi:hypothetical protein